MLNRSGKNALPKTCEECGTLFAGKPPRQRFCNKFCASKYRQRGIEERLRLVGVPGECIECGAEFTPKRPNQVFCSERCRDRRSGRRCYWANHEHYKEMARRRLANNPLAVRRQRQSAHLKLQYGLPYAEYERIFETQQGKCAICGQSGMYGLGSGKATDRLCVDHDHVTDSVRGLLCTTCNSGLGMFKDSPDLLAKAMGYLQFYVQEQSRRTA